MTDQQAPNGLTDELVSTLLEGFDEIIQGDPDWKENPVDLDTFVTSPLYQDLPVLSPRQRRAAIKMLGEDPKKMFRRTSNITTGVLLWGKGSGKDYLTSIIISYISYVLCCLKSPQKYLGVAPGEPLDIINVAYSASQANLVFFAKLKQRLQKPMFARFNPNIIEDKVEFPNQVRLHSRHSENESYEGFNILAWVMDEACFSDDTQIQDVKTGKTKTAIEWYKSQEKFFVRAYDFKKKETVIQESGPIFRKSKSNIYEVVFKSGRKIRVSGQHKFYHDSEQWKPLADLKAKDRVLIRDKVISGITGQEFDQINNTHLNKYGMTFEQYKKVYPDLITTNLRKQTLFSERAKKYWKDNPEKAKLFSQTGNNNYSEERKLKVVESNKKRQFKIGTQGRKGWEAMIKKNTTKSGYQSKPTSIELKMKEILKKAFGDEWKYSGIGWKYMIGQKIPDFIHIDKKKIIEVAGRHWHKPEYEQERIQHFAKYGYETLVVWDEEFKDIKTLTKRVLDFSRNHDIIWDEIESITYLKNDYVYDFEVPIYHNYMIDGIISHNSAFKDKTKRANADAIFSTLKSSATSRFGQQWIGIIISYPRYQNDFTIRQYELSKTQPHIYGDMGATWEIHPIRKREDFADDYRTDPEDARTKYECIPPAITDAFFSLTNKIYECNSEVEPVVFVDHTTTIRKAQEGENKEYTALMIEPLKKDFSRDYFIHGDPGLMSDSFVLAMGHVVAGEEKEIKKDEEVVLMPKVHIDLILVWKPQDGKPVDILNVKDTIIMLSTCFNIKSVTFDKWNSATTIQELVVNGIKAEDLSFSRGQQLEMFRNLRALVYNNLIDWPSNPDLCEELAKLQLINGVKVDHPVDGSKDIADAVAGCAWKCSEVKNDIWIMSL
jgi:very-short-patch-repair endonuclease